MTLDLATKLRAKAAALVTRINNARHTGWGFGQLGDFELADSSFDEAWKLGKQLVRLNGRIGAIEDAIRREKAAAKQNRTI